MTDLYSRMHDVNYMVMRDALQIAAMTQLCNSPAEVIKTAAVFAKVLEQADATVNQYRHEEFESRHG
jgi:hypothetical protein